MTNLEIAKSLSLQGDIRFNLWVDSPVEAIPEGINTADKVEGMMLGLAIGDALGNTSESMLPNRRKEIFGWIDDYQPNWYADNQRIGLPSDDTQLAYWTLAHLLDNGSLNPQMLGAVFSQNKIFGIGSSVKEFIGNFKSGIGWDQAGSKSAGNGALMRIAPVIIPHLQNPGANTWADVALAAHLTHRDTLSTIACIAYSCLLTEAIRMTTPPPGLWWVDRFIDLVSKMETDQTYAARANHPPEFKGKISELLRDYVKPALQHNLSVIDACAIWHSGAYCLETIPCVLYILARHGDDPVQAILEAVNKTRDNDTIAAIVGAAVGALHGRSNLPVPWQNGLVGRTTHNDDAKVFSLLAQAGDYFGYGASAYVRSRAALCM